MTHDLAGAVANLTGYVTALPTPFKGGRIDQTAFTALCDWQLGHGISGLVVNGTTGEAPTLSLQEQRRLIQLALDVAGQVPVIAGAGSSSTAHTIELAHQAEALGAAALLIVTPYYNKPSQEGLFQHFRAVHEATGLPILLYDVPSRTGCTLAVETVCRLAELPRILGLKDATGDLARPGELRRRLGPSFRLFSGDDATAFDFMRLGGDGCISVASNIVPTLCCGLHGAVSRGSIAEARVRARALAPLIASLFLEGNPVPVKYALSLMGRMGEEVRLPLCPPGLETRATIAARLDEFGLLSSGIPTAHWWAGKTRWSSASVAASEQRALAE